MGAILHRGVDPRAQAEHAHARTAGRDIRSEPARRLDVWPQVARRARALRSTGLTMHGGDRRGSGMNGAWPRPAWDKILRHGMPPFGRGDDARAPDWRSRPRVAHSSTASRW